MELIREILPYAVSVITALIAYFKSKKEYKVELEKLEKLHKNELEMLVKQHDIDIDNLKEKHKLEMESKEKDYKHEIEMQKLKSQTAIDEKTKEQEGNVLYGLMGDVFKDVITGKISKKQLEDLASQFPKK